MADIVILSQDSSEQHSVGQRGFRRLRGIGQFNSTDASGTLIVAGLTTIDNVSLTPLGAPGAATESVSHLISTGSLSGTFNFTGRFAKAGTVTSAWVITQNTISPNGTNFWSLGIVNKGAAGAGTAKIVDSTVLANTTNSGGSTISAYTPFAMTLGAAVDLVVAAGDAFLFTATATVTPTAFNQASFGISYSTNGSDETLYCSQAVNAGRMIPTAGKITINRSGNSKTSGLVFNFEIKGR